MGKNRRNVRLYGACALILHNGKGIYMFKNSHNTYLRTLVFVLVFMTAFFAGCADNTWSGSIYVEHSDDYMILHTPEGDIDVRYLSIEEVSYMTSWDAGELVSGTDNEWIKCGTYSYEGVEYQLHIYNEIEQYILLYYNGNVLVFNSQSEDVLELKEYIVTKAFPTSLSYDN